MGGGKEKKETNRMLNEQAKWARSGADAYNAIAQPQQQQSVNAANAIQQSTFDNLNRVGQGAGWIDPKLRQHYLNNLGLGSGGGGSSAPKPSGGGSIRSGGGGSSSGGGGSAPTDYWGEVGNLYKGFTDDTGNVDVDAIRGAMGGMRSVAGSGGWDAASRAAQQKNIASFEEFGRTGGLSADDMNRMRGGGVFENFQKTGGYTPDQLSDIRTRANSTLPAYYDAIRQGSNRMASIQGGNPAAQAAMSARLGRDQAKGMREQTLDTELGLSDRIREGQQWGAEGGAQAEGALQNLRTGNQLAGLAGATDARGSMLNSIAQNQVAGSQGWTQGELGLGGLVQEGQMFGVKGMENIANQKAQDARQRAAQAAAARNAAANRAAAARNAAASRSMASNAQQRAGLQWMANFEAGNTLNAAGGMNDLYRSAPGEVNMWNNALLANRGQQTQDVNMVTQNRMQNNPQTSWVDAVSQIGGAVAGGMTGLGAMGMGGKAAGGGMQMGQNVKNYQKYL